MRMFSALTALLIGAAGIGLAGAAPTRPEILTLVSPAGAPDGSYGSAVAMDADRAAVAWSEIDDDGAALGRVTIYVFTPDGWAEEQTLSSGVPGDGFGTSVALDGARLVVGAPAPCADPADGEELTGEAGTVHLFFRSAGAWQPGATMTDQGDCARFGSTVAIDGDRIAAGWRAHDDSEGGVTIFERSGADWKRTSRVASPVKNAARDSFGASGIALEGGTLAVGAPSRRLNGDGAVYVFVPDGKRWFHDHGLSEPGRGRADRFGSSVALERNLIVVGDPDGVGSVHVFEQTGSSWNHRARLNPDTGNVGDLFGASVAISARTIAVGAPAAGTPGGAGQAHAFTPKGNGWELSRTFTASDASAQDALGSVVAIAEDIVLSGAPGWDGACGTEAGAAYLFPLRGASSGDEADVRCGSAAGMSATITDTLAVSTGAATVPVTGTVTSLYTGVGTVFVTFRMVTGVSSAPTVMSQATVSCAEPGATQCTWSVAAPKLTGRYSVTAFPRDAFGRHGKPSDPKDIVVVGHSAV